MLSPLKQSRKHNSSTHTEGRELAILVGLVSGIAELVHVGSSLLGIIAMNFNKIDETITHGPWRVNKRKRRGAGVLVPWGSWRHCHHMLACWLEPARGAPWESGRDGPRFGISAAHGDSSCLRPDPTLWSFEE